MIKLVCLGFATLRLRHLTSVSPSVLLLHVSEIAMILIKVQTPSTLLMLFSMLKKVILQILTQSFHTVISSYLYYIEAFIYQVFELTKLVS